MTLAEAIADIISRMCWDAAQHCSTNRDQELEQLLESFAQSIRKEVMEEFESKYAGMIQWYQDEGFRRD